MTTTTTDRTSHQHDWPTQLRLPGQAAAPDGPVDLSMMYLMHHAFRRDLTAFAAAVPRTPLADLRTWAALARRWEIFSTALHHHHAGEDTWLWPALMERAGDDERDTLVAMEAEHGHIDPLLTACAERIRAHAAGTAWPVARAALAVHLVDARETLGRHLAHEERDAMGILQRHLTQADWESIEVHFAEGIEKRELLTLVPWLLHGLPEPVRAEVYAKAGAVPRLIWRLTHRSFERLDAQAFGYRVR